MEGHAAGPATEERGIDETVRASSRMDGFFGCEGGGGEGGAGAAVCDEVNGSRRNHDDQLDGSVAAVVVVAASDCGTGCGGVGCAMLALLGSDVVCAARACCIHSSRVLWSTGHFSSAPAAASEPGPFIPALFPSSATSLLTRTVSRRSLCIMRARRTVNAKWGWRGEGDHTVISSRDFLSGFGSCSEGPKLPLLRLGSVDPYEARGFPREKLTSGIGSLGQNICMIKL